MSGDLALAFALIGAGALMVWVGFRDPADGLFGVVADAFGATK